MTGSSTSGRAAPVAAMVAAEPPAGEDTTAAGDSTASSAAWLDRAEAICRRVIGTPLTSESEAFLLRLRRWWPDLWEGLTDAYARHPARDDQLESLVEGLAARWRDRSASLRELDRQRSLHPDWFQGPDMVGYVFYVDRFAGTLDGVAERMDYLQELGVRYVHFMPLLRTRPGEDDGGYAVADYRTVDPELGTIEDLERICRLFRERGMSVCIDIVLNHCAAEHEWAQRALAGDPEYEQFFWIFPDRTMPDRYEKTLPEVFPDFAPGNFTRLPDGRWVWTTFNRWQWDLQWANPRVFVEIVDILLDHANRGVDVFRLDAVAFMWKRLGTNCQNQPEVHSLLRALRACARIAAPAVLFKAEAIVGPDDLAPYLGIGRHRGHECDLAYHNSLMVQFWSALAARDTRLMHHVLGTFPRKPPTTAWGTYIRCHDDIGWAVTEDDAEAVGWSGPAHRSFLSDFYAGVHPGSFARGAVFQVNPATNDSRISGTFASLAGLEAAVEAEDAAAVDLAIARILLGHALIMGWDGIPLLYMGDEIGLRNDLRYLAEPNHASDNRWIHRPRMDWERAAWRHDPATVEGRIFGGTRRLVEVRRGLAQLNAAGPLDVVDLGNPSLFSFIRRHPTGTLLAIHNLTETAATIDAGMIEFVGMDAAIDVLDPGTAIRPGQTLEVPAYGSRWLVQVPGGG